MGESLVAAFQVLCKRKMKLAKFKVLELWGFVRFVGLFIFFSFLP